ncbi:MAG TPA: histidine--tRNA ligase, partial [Spirillospora sp.]|nr:histidine--tRNA ligase [Spirillospora sp.]
MSNVKIQPRLPKGMRDYLPQAMLKREYVFGVVRDVFHLYGFEPLQTPVLELNEILMGKYGEEAEKLIYHAQHPGGKEELALRYDLTVPLARVIGQYQSDISLPFKRYQLSPVWRAERPQRGRYREFYQCDVDIVGVADMSADAEVIGVVVTALKKLGFPQFTVKLNNRKLLTAIGQYSGVPDSQLGDLYRSVDKFDKIGADGVRQELIERGIDQNVVAKMMDLILAHEPGLGNLDVLEQALGDIVAAQEGIRELRELAACLADMYISPEDYSVDFTMVRGLGYYTGPVFEAELTFEILDDKGRKRQFGSVAGGGRYDGLVERFTGQKVPATGVSIGVDRLLAALRAKGLMGGAEPGPVVVTVMDRERMADYQAMAAELRAAGIRAEVYLGNPKNFGNQLKYADRRNSPLA